MRNDEFYLAMFLAYVAFVLIVGLLAGMIGGIAYLLSGLVQKGRENETPEEKYRRL